MELENDYSDYVISKEDQKWLDSISNNINRSVDKYRKDLVDFEKYLLAFPSLGHKHKIGKEINRAIHKDMYSPYFSPNTDYFKARKVVSDSVLKKKDFKNPPIGKSAIGRFNWEGQSVLYISTTKEGACEEICETNNQTLVWLAKIEYEKGESKILDLTHDPFNFEPLNNNLLQVAILNLGLITRRTSKENGNWKPEYLMTNFIADCCKEAGYDGIAYSSSKYYSTNLVIFKEYRAKVKILGNPEIIEYKPDINYRRFRKRADRNHKS